MPGMMSMQVYMCIERMRSNCGSYKGMLSLTRASFHIESALYWSGPMGMEGGTGHPGGTCWDWNKGSSTNAFYSFECAVWLCQ